MIFEIMVDCDEVILSEVLNILRGFPPTGSGGGMIDGHPFRYGLRILEDPNDNTLLGYCDADDIHKGRAQKHFEMPACVNWQAAPRDALKTCIKTFIAACENEPDHGNFRPHIGKAMVNNAKQLLEKY